MPLDSDRLTAFIAVAEQLGFSRAARTLGKTQSAVSQAVLRPEEDVGQALFVREGRATRLTRAGEILLEHARSAFGEIDRARRRLAALASLDEGELVIGTSDTFACYLLPALLARYRRRYPKVDLRLDNRPSPAIAREVHARRIDVGVVSLPLPSEREAPRSRVEVNTAVTVLGPLDDVAIVSPTHPLSSRHRVPAPCKCKLIAPMAI
jgi:DNA-binding transcriptional LysR family regulator